MTYNKKLKQKIVVDAKGRTLYMFARDTKGFPTCLPQRDRLCAVAWPGLKTVDQPTAGGPVAVGDALAQLLDAALLGEQGGQLIVGVPVAGGGALAELVDTAVLSE